MTDDWLRTLFSYDPNTGDITYRKARGSMRVGDVAGTVASNGYLMIMTNGKKYLAHRLAWFLHTGAWPDMDLDHIDRNRCNNKWDNLREATRKENQANRDVHTRHTRQVASGRWRSDVKIDGRVVYCGTFDTEQQAHDAALAKVASR